LGATPRSDVHCIGRCTRCDGWCDAVARDVATAVRRPLLDAVLPWCDCCYALLPLKRVVRRWCDGGVLPATWSADDALLRLGGGHSSLLAEPWWRTTTTHARNLWPFGWPEKFAARRLRHRAILIIRLCWSVRSRHRPGWRPDQGLSDAGSKRTRHRMDFSQGYSGSWRGAAFDLQGGSKRQVAVTSAATGGQTPALAHARNPGRSADTTQRWDIDTGQRRRLGW